MNNVFSLAILILLVTSTPSWGRPKSDIVTLHNGDRITCEVKSLFAGILQ